MYVYQIFDIRIHKRTNSGFTAHDVYRIKTEKTYLYSRILFLLINIISNVYVNHLLNKLLEKSLKIKLLS